MFERFDGTLKSLPERSALYYLEPIGIGTPMADSMSSYFLQHCELLEAHPYEVMAEVVAPRMQAKFYSKSGDFSAYRSARAHNGIGAMAEDWVAAMQGATMRNDLIFTTLLPYRRILTQYNLLRKMNAWCPHCFEGWKEQGTPVYNPLLWKLACVRACPVHGQELQELCPHCSRQSEHLGPRVRLGHCTECGKWLGNRDDYSLDPHDEREALWVATQVGELLAAAPKLKTFPKKDSVARFLSYLVDTRTKGRKSNFARLVGQPSSSVSCWMDGTYVPRLQDLARICFVLQVPLVYLLHNHDELKKLDIISSEYEKVPAKAVIPAKRIAWEEVRELMDRMIQGEITAESLAHIAVRFGVHISRLYQEDGERCKAVTEIRTTQETRERKSQKDALRLGVFAAAKELHGKGEYPSHKKIISMVGKDSQEARDYIAEAIADLRIQQKRF
jgi:transcriptional regulator with XRE-family HTH domain